MAGVLIAALAALWVWVVINLPSAPPPFPQIRRALHRLPRGRTLTGCPWCLGAWLAFGAYVLHTASEGSWDAVGTPLGAVAAAGATGLLGALYGLLNADDEPTED